MQQTQAPPFSPRPLPLLCHIPFNIAGPLEQAAAVVFVCRQLMQQESDQETQD